MIIFAIKISKKIAIKWLNDYNEMIMTERRALIIFTCIRIKSNFLTLVQYNIMLSKKRWAIFPGRKYASFSPRKEKSTIPSVTY